MRDAIIFGGGALAGAGVLLTFLYDLGKKYPANRDYQWACDKFGCHFQVSTNDKEQYDGWLASHAEFHESRRR